MTNPHGTTGIATSPFQIIANEAPELALVGAVIKLALEDAQSGNAAA